MQMYCLCTENVHGKFKEMNAISRSDNLSWIEPLASGHAGTLRTLQVMVWLVRKDYRSPSVVNTVRFVLAAAPRQSIVESLFLFARDQIHYEPDPPNCERVSDFDHTTESRQGDCDDKVVWLATALLCCGLSVRLVVQSYAGNSWDHVYLEFYD